MMCRDLAEELFYFDLRKEKELQQVFLEFAAAQLARHEKVSEHGVLIAAFAMISGLARSQLQGKWYAMQFLLEEPISPDLRAIQFLSGSGGKEPGNVHVSSSSSTMGKKP